jgi:hypothetical protein
LAAGCGSFIGRRMGDFSFGGYDYAALQIDMSLQIDFVTDRFGVTHYKSASRDTMALGLGS